MLDVIVNAPCTLVPKYARSLSCYRDFMVHALLALEYPIDALPYAALLAKAKKLPGSYVMVSLVHWQASHNDAMFLAVDRELGLDSRQLRIWFEELSPLLEDGGSQVFDAGNGQWLLSVGNKERVRAEPPSALRHQSLMPAIAGLGTSGAWQKLFTEAQMFLHAHPLNSRTEKHTINGLWFWGGGVLSGALARPLYTDSSVLQHIVGAQSLDALPTSNIEDGVVVLENPDNKLLNRCQALAKTQESRWYWQDAAYAMPVRSWWKRFISRSRTCE